VHPVALFTYTIWTYSIYDIYIYICNPQSQLFFFIYFFISFVTSLHVSAPTGHLQVKQMYELMLIHLFQLKMARRGRNM
jgi:hypothetical protein